MDELKQDHIAYKSVLEFWFSKPANKQWFKSTSKFDAQILAKFHSTWMQAKENQLNHWKETAEGSLALVIVLDQFPLNMFRGTAKSFSTENNAIEISHTAILCGFDKLLTETQLAFLYMPFMHSESLDDQNYSVELFDQAGLDNNLRFAKHHRDIIKEYGRFPHRNKILGRSNTAAEIEYLASPQAFKG